MQKLILCICTALFVSIVTTAAAPESTCMKIGSDCVRAYHCCSGCCVNEKCIDFADSCQIELEKLGAGKGGPCANLQPPCTTNEKCELRKCSGGSCKPVPVCVPEDYNDYNE